MDDFYRKVFKKIKNHQSLENEELCAVERALKLVEVNDSILNYQIGLTKDNPLELTAQSKYVSRFKPVDEQNLELE